MTKEEQTDWLCRLRSELNSGVIDTPWNKKFIEALTGVLEQETCEDCISRQAVLDITWEEPSYTDAMNVLTEVRDKVKELPSVNPKQKWIPVSERLPKDFGTYLITLEGGDVCKCEFNPDFIDEEHENGAFTYYHQYFDPATLGLIDGEDEAVDAIAWMPFEPYDPQESEDKE